MNIRLFKNDFSNPILQINKKEKDYDLFKNNHLKIFVYGYLYKRDNYIYLNANDIFNLYLSNNNLKFIGEIDGIYTIIIIDDSIKKCFIITDRYGLYSLFYYMNENMLIISDKIREFIPFLSIIELNKKSIINYLIFGYGFKIGKETHIKNINEFEGANIYLIDEKLIIREKNYWNFIDFERKRYPFEEFLKKYNNHVNQVNKLSNRIAVSLSGGLDTRTHLSSLLLSNTKFHCYTYGENESLDFEISRYITEKFCLEHYFYRLDSGFFNNLPVNLNNNYDIFNGLISTIRFLHIKKICEREKNKADLIILGILGDEIWRYVYGNKLNKNPTYKDIIDKILKTNIKNYKILDVFKNNSHQEVINILRESIIKEINKLLINKKTINPSFLLDYFAYKSFCSNWANNIIKFMGKYFKIFLSLVNKELLEQIILYNSKQRLLGIIQKKIILNNNKKLLEIPFDNEIIKLKVKFNNFEIILRFNFSIIKHHRIKNLIRNFIIIIIKKFNHISFKLLKKNLFKIQNNLNYIDYLRSHKDFIISTLNYKNMKTKSFFKEKEIKKIIKSFLNGNDSYFEFISSLLSLEIWAKKILEIKNRIVE